MDQNRAARNCRAVRPVPMQPMVLPMVETWQRQASLHLPVDDRSCPICRQPPRLCPPTCSPRDVDGVLLCNCPPANNLNHPDDCRHYRDSVCLLAGSQPSAPSPCLACSLDLPYLVLIPSLVAKRESLRSIIAQEDHASSALTCSSSVFRMHVDVTKQPQYPVPQYPIL